MTMVRKCEKCGIVDSRTTWTFRRGGRQGRRLQRLVLPDVRVDGVRPRRGRAGGPGERLNRAEMITPGAVTVGQPASRRPAADAVGACFGRQRFRSRRRSASPSPEATNRR